MMNAQTKTLIKIKMWFVTILPESKAGHSNFQAKICQYLNLQFEGQRIPDKVGDLRSIENRYRLESISRPKISIRNVCFLASIVMKTVCF